MTVHASLDFLRKFHPGGLWVLTAIGVDRKSIETVTFTEKTSRECAEWIAKRNADDNIYFNINPVRYEVSKKAGREDVARVTCLHVDIDPRVGEPVEEEQARIRALMAAPPGGIPAPTWVVYSGGGYQGFWALEEPLAIDGDIAAAESAARYNMQLEVVLGGDNCHNVDRIGRLPGTINWPDAKKKKKGRVKALAAVLSCDMDRVYPLSAFMPAPPRQTSSAGVGGTGGGFAGASGGTDDTVVISGNVARLGSVDDLPDTVLERTKVVIVQGLDPDSPGKHPSRSEWLFSVVCDLLRAGVADEVIYSVITDPDFGISASVLDKGSRSERYARDQIRRAKERFVDPWLLDLNDRFAVIASLGGKCRVVEEVMDPTVGRPRLTKQSFEDFRNRWCHKKLDGPPGPKGQATKIPVGAWWLGHEQRRQYEGIVFSPGRDVPGYYNLWQGFSVEARPGDGHLGFLEHLHTNLCRGNDEHYSFLLGWMANAVQHPDQPGQSAIVLRGRQGTGKSFFAEVFGRLFGRHFLVVSNASHMTGNFNSHLRDCVVLFGDEAFYAGDAKHTSVLKTLVTSTSLVYEAKGIDSERGPNFIHLIMASNSSWVVPAGTDDRRFFVLDVDDAHREDHAYFKGIEAEMEAGGYGSLLHTLLTMPLAGFNVRATPKTQALLDQKVFSMSNEEEWWYEKLETGDFFMPGEGWPSWVQRQAVADNYLNHMNRIGRHYRSSPTALRRFLARVMPNRAPSVVREITEQTPWEGEVRVKRPGYEMPSLEKCREHWTSAFGKVGEWT